MPAEAPIPPDRFNREAAFSRSIGLLTRDELEILKNKTIAIAGLGGVGGAHLLTLTRLGIGSFHLADMDTFEIENFNRQAGASMKTLGRAKIEVMAEMALAINPELKIKTFPAGVHQGNIHDFFKGVDAYADALDFFSFQSRAMVFDHCFKNDIPATTVGPIGMGAALLNFLPGKMSFQDYFQWKETDEEIDLGIKFLVGLTPKFPHLSYLVDPASVRMKENKGPSTPMGCELCAGVMGTELLKILLNRGKIRNAPHSILFDAYHNKVFHQYVWGGNKNPLQRLKIALAKKSISKRLQEIK